MAALKNKNYINKPLISNRNNNNHKLEFNKGNNDLQDFNQKRQEMKRNFSHKRINRNGESNQISARNSHDNYNSNNLKVFRGKF